MPEVRVFDLGRVQMMRVSFSESTGEPIVEIADPAGENEPMQWVTVQGRQAVQTIGKAILQFLHDYPEDLELKGDDPGDDKD